MTNRIIRYRFMGWFVILQEGNSEHTLRDGSQHLLVTIVTKKQRCDEHLLKWQLPNQIWTGLKLAINSD